MGIEVSNLTKKYGDNIALNNLSFNIQDKGLYLLAGPNGSGKTTLMEILTKIIKPSSGEISYGSNISSANFNDKIGILLQQSAIRKNLTVSEELKFVSDIFGKKLNIKDYIIRFGLEKYANTYSQRLSGGLQRRLLIATLFIPDFDILFFDEPASGLDVQSRDFIWSVIKECSREKICIVSDHYLNQAASYCDQILMLSKGNLIFEGATKKLLDDFQFNTRVQSLNGDNENIENKLNDYNYFYERLEVGARTTYYIKQETRLVKDCIDYSNHNIKEINIEDVYVYLSEKEGN